MTNGGIIVFINYVINNKWFEMDYYFTGDIIIVSLIMCKKIKYCLLDTILLHKKISEYSHFVILSNNLYFQDIWSM